MKRLGCLLLILACGVMSDVGRSQAEVTQTKGSCFTSPGNTLIPCSTSPTPTRALIVPNETLSVSGPTQAPLGTTSYSVTVTSQVACFPLDEPILLYTLGGGAAAVLSPVQPQGLPAPSPQSVVVHMDPTTATATLSLEVLNRALGTAGLVVKAVWPQESVEHLAQVVAPASPTPTATLVPGQATNTPVPTPTTTTTTLQPLTPAPAPTATTTALSFFVRACVSPNPSQPKDSPTIYVQTLPGAVCTAIVLYTDNSRPKKFDGGQQTAGPDGFAIFSFNQSTTAKGGTVTASCVSDGVTLPASASFVVSQPVTPTPTAVR